MNCNRINPEEVKKAYAKTGLKPQRHKFLNGGCACGLGSVYAQKTGRRDAFGKEIVNYIKALFSVNIDYIYDFIDGFDGHRSFGNSTEYMTGYVDGQAAWERVKNLRGSNAKQS